MTMTHLCTPATMDAISCIAGSDASLSSRLEEPPDTNTNEQQDAVQNSPEDTLESHEVIELHAFIERKVWIEEKIQFLETLPPIEVFAGMDDLKNPMDKISGLATRAQLDEWILEYDRIEKETETFDSGDLKKLKKFTKACTQRNLSPEDTDLIELTLTTLYALDKLLHLLRDRSENLDLLGLRLTWEENRARALTARHSIIDDLQVFLTTRARWSPIVYTSLAASAMDTAKPRSMSLTTSVPADSTELFSRGLRFKLLEDLSRDAAQLSSKVTALRHGHVASTGKVLDKLIEDSRRPVPDAMLDEQDRVEEKCANELEAVGKFLMAVVAQWKMADEIYNETRKDINMLRRIQEEILYESSRHPSRRLEINYSSRVDAVAKRITNRTNPVSPRGTFPFPTHILFPSQVEFNTSLVKSLSAELAEAAELLGEANDTVETYRSRCTIVEDAESLRTEIGQSRQQIISLTDRLRNGFQSDDGDGSPPDLSLTECVEPLCFSSYLAVLPSLTERIAKVEDVARAVLGKCTTALLRLDKPGIDTSMKEAFACETADLESDLRVLLQSRDATLNTVAKLRDVRRIWATLVDLLKQVETLTVQTREALGRERWKQQFVREELPPTPEGSQIELPVHEHVSTSTSMERLNSLHDDYTNECETPFKKICHSLPQSLLQHFENKFGDFRRALTDLKDMSFLLLAVRKQAASMGSILDEAHELIARMDELKLLSEELSQDILQGATADVAERERLFGDSVLSLNKDIKAMTGSLPTRVIYISRGNSAHPNTGQETPGDNGGQIETSKLPFSCAAQDRIVRHDANTVAMSLNGGILSLNQKELYLHACALARSVDIGAADIDSELALARTVLDNCRERLQVLFSSTDAFNGVRLQELKSDLESTPKTSAHVQQTLSATRLKLAQLRDIVSNIHDPACQNLIKSRTSSLDRVEELYRLFTSTMDSMRAEVASFEPSLTRMEAEGPATVNVLLLKEQATDDGNLDFETGNGDDTLVQDDVSAEEVCSDGVAVLTALDKELGRQDRHSSRDGLMASASGSSTSEDPEEPVLLRIRRIAQKLHSLTMGTHCNQAPFNHRVPSSLPTSSTFENLNSSFSSIREEVALLPTAFSSQVAKRELENLKRDVHNGATQLKHIEHLVRFSTSVAACDTAFSELLNHIDSYPSLPDDAESSPNLTLPEAPEELLSTRLSSTKNAVSDLSEQFAVVADDSRAAAEHSRIIQTWEELMDMAMDRINGRSASRQAGVGAQSSGRNSSASVRSAPAKHGKYATLSQGAKAHLPPIIQRRTMSNSGSDKLQGRPSQRTAQPTSSRAVSGPIPQSSSASSLFKSTFASRQRTTSTTGNTATAASKISPAVGKVDRRGSAMSNSVDHGNSSSAKSSSPRGTWSRAPRQSFSNFERPRTPLNKITQWKKKRYVANPANKLDVAVGDVVNRLPVNIDIEVVADTWKDQSGKYWIGGDDPKLCFCRILRSQTVMVRVGGGWSELSRFIQDHFADLFRLMPESPPRPGSKEAKWISASTLREASDIKGLGSMSPQTPEPIGPLLPSFALSSPDGTNTHSLRSESSFGSPLTPLQFIRRAGNEPSDLSMSTPSRASSVRPPRRSSLGMSTTPSKFAVWRP